MIANGKNSIEHSIAEAQEELERKGRDNVSSDVKLMASIGWLGGIIRDRFPAQPKPVEDVTTLARVVRQLETKGPWGIIGALVGYILTDGLPL